MDLVINKIFQCFYIRVSLQFFQRKGHFSICYVVLKYLIKKEQIQDSEYNTSSTFQNVLKERFKTSKLLYDLLYNIYVL